MKIRYLLLGILLLASILRLINIGQVPYGLSNDESSYIYSAYSLWKTGKGIDGTLLPISFNTDSSNSPVPIYLSAPFVGLLGVSMESGRLPYILFGIGSILLLYFLVKELFENESIALLSAFVLSVSPWHLHVTRTAYDTVFASFFVLLGLYLFIRSLRGKSNILWSLIPFFLAFYSYHATKIVFLFLIPVVVILFIPVLKKNKKSLALFILGYIAIILTFIFSINFGGITRQEETLLSLNDPRAASTVNYERRYNEAPNYLKTVFNNKPAYFLRVVKENYLEAFSTNFLFLYGDTTSSAMTLGVLSRGVMYLLELPLLLLGIYHLLRNGSEMSKKIVFAGILVAPLASTFVSGKSYILRDFNMTSFLAIFVALGIYYGHSFLKKYSFKFRSVLTIGFFAIYAIFIASYLYQYHYRYPVYGAEAWFRSNREVSELVIRESKTKNHLSVFLSGKIMLAQYGIFGKIDPAEIQKAWSSNDKSVGNVDFVEKCPDLINQIGGKREVFILPAEGCPQDISPSFTIFDYGESKRPLWNLYEI